MNPPLLSVERLTLEFETGRGTVKALENVNFGVSKGEILGVVGESGSGKSVLSLAIMSLLDASATIKSGKIVYMGEDAINDSAFIERMRGKEISIIFQSPRTSLNPIRSIGHQIVDVLKRHEPMSHDSARKEALAALHRVGIPDAERRFHSYPFELSGGMCQRVLIAAALACKPSLLLADEPTTGLDVTTQAAVMDLIRDMVRASGMSVMLVTHDLALAAEYCDRIMVMHAGHIVESAPTALLMSRPAHPYTQRLIAATPTPEARLSQLVVIPGQLPDLRGALPVCRFMSRCDRSRPDCSVGPLSSQSLDQDHLVLCRYPG